MFFFVNGVMGEDAEIRGDRKRNLLDHIKENSESKELLQLTETKLGEEFGDDFKDGELNEFLKELEEEDEIERLATQEDIFVYDNEVKSFNQSFGGMVAPVDEEVPILGKIMIWMYFSLISLAILQNGFSEYLNSYANGELLVIGALISITSYFGGLKVLELIDRFVERVSTLREHKNFFIPAVGLFLLGSLILWIMSSMGYKITPTAVITLLGISVGGGLTMSRFYLDYISESEN
jgi:hypothetical protein